MVRAQPEMLLATIPVRNFVRFCSVFRRERLSRSAVSLHRRAFDLRNISFARKYEGEKKNREIILPISLSYIDILWYAYM